ncbi:MAG: spermidine/putrescine ABC transporter permease [Acidimicrobiales bacterium]|nr:spermidine/putrescine ABC transporter permease [Acidimicrobiales bacterium]
MSIPGPAGTATVAAETGGEVTSPPPAPAPDLRRQRSRRAGGRQRLGLGRLVFLALLGIYFFVPLLAMARFSLQRIPVVSLTGGNLLEGWSLQSLVDVMTDPKTIEVAQRSLLLAAGAIVLTLVLLVPVATYVEVMAPRLRPVVLVMTLAPWVVPPIALVVGVAGTFRTAAPWFLASVYSLVPFYALWALPFSYRAIDAGLRALDVRTLYEATQSIGAPGHAFFFRVVLPNLSSSILVVAALTGATVLGEFAFASLLLKETLPTYLVVIQGSNPRAGLALALVVLVLTAAIIGFAVSLLRRRGITFTAAGI